MTALPRHRKLAVACIAALLGTASLGAVAQQSPALDRASIWVGGYYSNNDTDLSANGRREFAGVNGKVNFEDDLGLEKHSTNPRVKADFLLGDHQGFSFDYYDIDRSKSHTYTEGLPEIGADVNARIRGKFDYSFGSAAYKWWFGHSNDVFGIGLGAAYYNVKLRLSGEASGLGETASASESFDDHEWAPMLTLGWRHAFNDQWRMYVDASGVRKNGGDLNGHIWNGAVGVEWFPWQNWGFALEYAATNLHLNKEYSDAKVKLDLDSNGPAFYLRARF